MNRIVHFSSKEELIKIEKCQAIGVNEHFEYDSNLLKLKYIVKTTTFQPYMHIVGLQDALKRLESLAQTYQLESMKVIFNFKISY